MGTARAVALLKSDSMGEYDPAIVDARDLLSAVTEPGPYLAGGGTTWSLVLAYNTDVYPGDTGTPRTGTTFSIWRVFPGVALCTGICPTADISRSKEWHGSLIC